MNVSKLSSKCFLWLCKSLRDANLQPLLPCQYCVEAGYTGVPPSFPFFRACFASLPHAATRSVYQTQESRNKDGTYGAPLCSHSIKLIKICNLGHSKNILRTNSSSMGAHLLQPLRSRTVPSASALFKLTFSFTSSPVDVCRGRTDLLRRYTQTERRPF